MENSNGGLGYADNANEYAEHRDEENEEEEGAEKEEEREHCVLKFLDSMDSYLTLFDSLSSTLRQGWLELASARHSMGTSRVNSTLFNHNYHSATTSLLVNLTDAIQEKGPGSTGLTFTVDKQIEKERSKSLSMFGTLVSPKLRAAQLSFETAVDTLVEIANSRSNMLTAYNQALKEMGRTEEIAEALNGNLCLENC